MYDRSGASCSLSLAPAPQLKRSVRTAARGSRAKRRLTDATTKDLAANEFDHFLLDPVSRGISVALVGTATVESGPAYKLKVILKDGAVRHSYIDKVSFLEVRRDYLDKEVVASQQWFRGHKPVDGVTRPTVFEMFYPSTGRRIVVALDRVEVNPAIPDVRFRLPSR